MSQAGGFSTFVFGTEVPAPRLLTWSLAAFHVAALGYSLVLYLWIEGELAGFFGDAGNELSSILGLVAFGCLWLASFIGTVQALPAKHATDLQSTSTAALIADGTVGGFFSGLWFLAIAGTLAMVAGVGIATVQANPRVVIIVLAAGTGVGTLGVPVAALIGGFLGTIVGFVDVVLLAMADRMVGPSPLPEDAETPAT